MLVIYGAIFGVIVGLLATAKLLVALLCGLFFAVVAWALTGFKMGSVSNLETTASVGNAIDRDIVGSRFTVLNGEGAMTPQELGAGFVVQASGPTEMLIDLLFAKKTEGFTLPLQQSVLSDPAPAKLYFTSLYVSSCISYVVTKLKVDDATLQKIAVGMYTQLPFLKLHDGKLVSKADIEQVTEMISKFTDLSISEKGETAAANDVEPTMSPTKTTELLISLIVNHYNGGGANGLRAVEVVKTQGFFHRNYAELTKMIEEAVQAPCNALQKTNLRWISE